MVALGFPVVPEVGASRATSSAAVATAGKLASRPSQRRTRSSLASPPYPTAGMPRFAASSSAVKR